MPALIARTNWRRRTPTTVRHHEVAQIGYHWFVKKGANPQYAFGYGWSDTSFAYREIRGGDTVTAASTVRKIGSRAGADIPQVYLTDAADDQHMRLLGFERVVLKPGESEVLP